MPSRPRRSVAPGPLPAGVRVVREELSDGPVPVARHPSWPRRFPRVAQGTTIRGPEATPFDLSLAGVERLSIRERWSALALMEGMGRVGLGRQIHGGEVRLHDGGPAVGGPDDPAPPRREDGPPRVEVTPDVDGHATAQAGVLLAVTVADCVPVFAVADDGRAVAVAILHAGWRGAAAGILGAGLRLLAGSEGVRPRGSHVHLGPAICGGCYEVGPEVHEALGLTPPGAPEPVDLRAFLAREAVAAGVPGERVTVSAWCTRCGDSPFFSHRGGDPERQAGFVGIRT